MYLNNIPTWINTECGLIPIGFDVNAKKHQPKEIIEMNETLNETYERVSAAIGVPVKELHDKYDHLNPGMQKMNLNNRLRNFNKVAK